VPVCADIGALIERSITAAESDAVEEVLGRHSDDEDALVSSSLA
jgi:hypothetical protein